MLFSKKEPKPKKVKKEKPPKAPKVKRPRKRISVLEIVSLISLFAVVGTVGYLVYKNHFKKQVPETDKELVNQLNQSLEKHFKNGKKVDLTEAIDGIESDGIIFSRLTLSDPDSDLVFDATQNLFGVFENGKGVTYPQEIIRKESKIDTTLWKFVKKNPGDMEKPFSYYLLDGCSGKVTVIGGVDVGKNQDIERVAYINALEKKQDVIIRTNSYETELIVTEDVGDNIAHYGRLGKLTVRRLHTDSYHEYGDCKYAYVPAGRVVAEKDGNIDVAYVVSPAAFLQEKDSGTIGKAYASTYRVRNNSNYADEKYGRKKELIYDDNETQEDNERIALEAGEAAQYTAVVEERIERGLENHPNAIGYTREDGAITIFDSYQEVVEHFSKQTSGEMGLVIVTGDGVLSEVLNISNLNITFRGNEDVMPTIVGNIEISHTSGDHQIIFENIKFSHNNVDKNNILDYSVKGSSTEPNSLQFKNCEFSYTAYQSNKSTIALAATNGVVSTRLSVVDSKFNYETYSQTAITTRYLKETGSYTNRGSKIVSDQLHVIKSNTFTCKKTDKNPAIVTNYAEIKDNSFEGYDTVLGLIPSLWPGDNFQFNVTITNNNFVKARYLFSLVDVDTIINSSSFVFNFEGSNTYSRVTHVGNFEIATTNRYIEKTIDSWKAKSWSGISDPSIGVTLDSMVMDLKTEPYFGNFTLSNGERIKSYTQVDNSEPRVGYTLKDDEGSTYYFYATFNNEVNVFFKEDTNDAYITLLSDGEAESLKIKELETPVDWLDESIFEDETLYDSLKYYDKEAHIGALYKIEDIFTTINGNTYKNCEVVQNEKYIRVNKLTSASRALPRTRLPSGYQEVESITFSSENGYIDTGIVINDTENLHITLDGQYNGYNPSFTSLFGFIADSKLPRLGLNIYQNKYMMSANGTYNAEADYSTDRATYELYTDSTSIYLDVNNERVIEASPSLDSIATNTLPLYVGCRNSNGSTNNFSGLTVYSMEVYYAEQIHTLVPCRRISDNQIGLYDLSSEGNEFKALNGGGTCGEDVESQPVELYISDIAYKEKLILTNEETPFVTDPTALVISLPEDSNVVLSGRYNVELKGTLKNLILRDRLHVTLLEGSKVINKVEISGKNAANIDFRNYGTLQKLVVNAKANVTNYGNIYNTLTGVVDEERYAEQILTESAGATINNNATISRITTYAETNIFNFSGGYIEDLTINYVKGYENLSTGSSITNNGTMCENGGLISIYAQARFVNLGIVGSESSTGYIVIGDKGLSSAHDGTVITNAGIMWAGKDVDDNTRLFVIYGINSRVGEIGPEVRIINTHTIRGASTYAEAVYTYPCDIEPLLDISLNL